MRVTLKATIKTEYKYKTSLSEVVEDRGVFLYFTKGTVKSSMKNRGTI